MSPALIVERFDIRHGPKDFRRFALEDFCSVLDLPASAKYDGTIERMARGLRPLSTDPAADLEILLRRAIFAWAIADGDMHLKNLALLKIAEVNARSFTSVRFAPLYDAVTTRVFPGLAGDRMALKLNGKDDRLTRGDFLTLARTIGISRGVAETAIAELTTNLANAVETVRLPAFAARTEAASAVQGQIMALVRARCGALADEAS
jgi:serine/threonine-protein kinase HipA